jgi:hypothetical protein
MIPYSLDGFEKHLEKFRPIPTAGTCKMTETNWWIMASSQGDIFHPLLRETGVQVLELIAKNPHVGDHLRVCTKRLEFDREEYNERSLPMGAIYGITLTTLSEEVSRICQPQASIPQELISHLYYADLLGLRTWVSSEPMIKGMDLLQAATKMEELGVIPTEWWPGHLNYGGEAQDYALSDKEIVCQFEEAKETFPDINWQLKTDVEVE